MFKRVTMILLIIVTLSAITLTVFAISDNDKIVNPGIQPKISPSSSFVTLKDRVELKYSVERSDRLEYKTTDNNRVKEINLLTIISPTEAQKIAEKYIKEEGAVPGTPKLLKENGKKVYIVPVIDNQKNVGEIHLDAMNGKNLEGCGGAP